MAIETGYRICPLCEAACGLDVTHENGRVIAVRGAEDDPFSEGYICPKGVALADLHNDPDRLRTPLIRKEGRLVEASYDEAFRLIEERLLPILSQHGPDSLGFVLGNPVSHHYSLALYAQRMIRQSRSRYVYSASTVDQIPKHVSSGLMFGHWMSIAVPDIARTDLLVVLGANPAASNGSLWTVPDFKGKAKALLARGGRMITIDPRRTETARLASEHHFLRPGADVFLLLAIVETLCAENLVKTGHLADHLIGLEELRAAARSFPPERVAERCGMAAETIRDLARQLAKTERAVLYGRIGTCVQAFGTLNSWLVDVINILTGNLDREGGAMFPKAAAFAANTRGKPGIGRGISLGRYASRAEATAEVMSEFPVSSLAGEIASENEDRLRALISIGTNPVLSTPNGDRLSEALDKLDFMVSFDIYLNETTRHADVILPGLSPLTESHWDYVFNQFAWRNSARFSAPVISDPDGRPHEWQMLLRLQAILRGLGADADLQALDDELTLAEISRVAGDAAPQVLATASAFSGPERLVEIELRSGPYGDQFGSKPDGLTLAKVIASGKGIDLGPHEPRIPELLRTPSGKIEVAPPLFIADLARVEADLSAPVPEILLIGRRDLRSNNSWMHNLPILAKGPNRCKALVHPDDANRLGLADGGRAIISAAGRSIVVEVEWSDDMMAGVISVPHGWGHDLAGARLGLAARNPGVNVNRLLDEAARDPLSGNSVLNGIAITVAPYREPGLQAAE
jgi:anaerobic selenocysteine-containing dehydrogenase